MTTRPMAVSKKAVVSSSSLPSSLIGAEIIRKGGNVFDALVATSLALAVTQNNLCGLGGDMFAILRTANGNVRAINGSGRAFESLSIEHFREKGLDKLPPRGIDAAITVPGMVMALNDIHSRYGSMEQSDLISPALALARDGFGVTENYSHSIAVSKKYLSQYNGWKNIFNPNDLIPEPGSLFRQKDLAGTLDSLKGDGLASYYKGHLADRIIDGLKRQGSQISSSDLGKHTSTWVDPLSVDYNGFRFYETAPNSQAVTALLWLNLLRQTGKAPEELSDSEIIEMGLIAYSARDREITDPIYHPLPSDFLTDSFASRLLSQAQVKHPHSGKHKQGDTTYFCIADSEGNSASVIQSNYMGFGSGIVPEGTGFVMQNRGSYFSLDPEHHNSLKGGKRTFHTLCASMIERSGKFAASIGTMGGDIQPQIHIQLFMNFLRGMNPQASLDKARWAFPYSIYETPEKLQYEDTAQEMELKKLGNKLSLEYTGFSSQLGHAQIVQTNRHGLVEGGADPRGDGISISV